MLERKRVSCGKLVAGALTLLLASHAWASIVINVGSGRDGDLTIPAGNTATFDASLGAATTSLMMPAYQGSTELVVNATDGFSTGDELMIYVSRSKAASGVAGSYELFRVAEVNGDNFITLNRPVPVDYDSNTANQIVSIQRIPNYRNVTIEGTLAARDYNNAHGGFIFFRTSDTLRISGTVTADYAGYLKGRGGQNGVSNAVNGQSYALDSTASSVGAGQRGANAYGQEQDVYAGGGGAGGYYTNGTAGKKGAAGGVSYFDPGNVEDVIPLAGGAGGGGFIANWHGYNSLGGAGGDGAGCIRMIAENVDFTGTIRARGGNGGQGGMNPINGGRAGNGGGGAGGLVWLQAYNALNLSSTNIQVNGGSGGSYQYGGTGGKGYCRVDYHYGPVPYAPADEWQMVVATVPEPATVGVLALGGAVMLIRRRAA